jgi:membrane associated rhomboid family serine protease
MIYAFVPQKAWIEAHLALTPHLALGREPWQLATSAFVHVHGLRLISSLIGVWVFATAVEQQTPRKRMFWIFAGSQLAGALVIAALGRLLAPGMVFEGCSPAVFGLMAAFGVIYGPLQLSFFGIVQMKGRTMALLVIGTSLLIGLLHLDFVGVAGDLAGVAAGYAITTYGQTGGASLVDRLRSWRIRRRYKVLTGGRAQKRYLN